jgi:hypothetical protein
MAETVTLPLTGNGDVTTLVAVDNTPDGVVQLFKLLVSADGSTVFLPADLDGLFVQSIARAESPQDDVLISVDVAPGGNVDLDASVITSGKMGRLMGIDAGASVPLRVDMQTVSPSRVTRSTMYLLPGASVPWRPPTPTFIELIGDGDNKFGVSITNLSPSRTADVRATVYWDEVIP